MYSDVLIGNGLDVLVPHESILPTPVDKVPSDAWLGDLQYTLAYLMLANLMLAYLHTCEIECSYF